MPDTLINRIAWVEIGLAALIVLFFAASIEEIDDVWALTFVFVALAISPALVLLFRRMSSFFGKTVKTLALALWPFMLFWLIAYG
ncbi:MAG: hypothetical protein WA793_01150 [Sphingorhabdus sp.]|uniref:hypothetical protein n=1 Tax=Sphingorhabdus sp. TaxID=1902408 RepID=UPI003CACBFB4